jgi:hypothetical protein
MSIVDVFFLPDSSHKAAAFGSLFFSAVFQVLVVLENLASLFQPNRLIRRERRPNDIEPGPMHQSTSLA